MGIRDVTGKYVLRPILGLTLIGSLVGCDKIEEKIYSGETSLGNTIIQKINKELYFDDVLITIAWGDTSLALYDAYRNGFREFNLAYRYDRVYECTPQGTRYYSWDLFRDEHGNEYSKDKFIDAEGNVFKGGWFSSLPDRQIVLESNKTFEANRKLLVTKFNHMLQQAQSEAADSINAHMAKISSLNEDN